MTILFPSPANHAIRDDRPLYPDMQTHVKPLMNAVLACFPVPRHSSSVFPDWLFYFMLFNTSIKRKYKSNAGRTDALPSERSIRAVIEADCGKDTRGYGVGVRRPLRADTPCRACPCRAARLPITHCPSH